MTRVAACVATFAISLASLVSCSEPNQPVHRQETAQRVVTLAPHLTELVFASGAADKLVGVSAYSDYPKEAMTLPVVRSTLG